ncbi:MAG: hypothetical protein KME47_09835 [Nodosilinea sp. WJT8-NPBG4]|jgi:hypothetical protein|nr:hypothetical protein [Nodosilinea sp. WJT8-NPBG4]
MFEKELNELKSQAVNAISERLTEDDKSFADIGVVNLHLCHYLEDLISLLDTMPIAKVHKMVDDYYDSIQPDVNEY